MFRLSIFSFKRQEAARFIGATALIFLIVAGVFELVLVKLGETLPYTKVIQQQNVSGVYYLPKYFNVDNQYKIKGIKHRAPEILAIGTSRIMPMSQDHVPQGSFYNAGVDASTSGEIDGMLNILKSLEDDELPKTIVVGIDPWLFNPNYPPNQESPRSRVVQFVDRYYFLKGAHSIYRFMTQRAAGYDLLVHDKDHWFKYLFADSDSAGIGVSAKSSKAGFSLDGSFHYPYFSSMDDMKNPDEWNEWLARDEYRFAPAERIDLKALNKFKALLQYCHERDVKVIGLLLPFRNDFYEALNSSEIHLAFFNKFRKIIPGAMNSFGYPCYDFSSPESLDLKRGDFVDIYHMKPVSFAKIVNHILYKRHAWQASGNAISDIAGQN